jgi:hypothetical protein
LPFTVGNYERATRAPFKSPNRPGLEISGNGAGCNTLTGRFTVREISVDATGNVLKFAADFVQSCDGGPALHGVVRFNSTLAQFPPEPIAAAGTSQTVREGDLVGLDGSNSYDLDGSIAAYKWTQVSGPAIASLPSTIVNPSFVAPNVVPGGEDVVIGLEVTDNSGLKASSTVMIRVQDATDPRTFIYFHSQPGDYIGAGLTQQISTDDGVFSATSFTATSGSGAIHIHFQGYTWWDANFVADSGPLSPGTYLLAERAPFQSPGHPGLDVSGDGRGCNSLSGRFTVLEAVYGTNYDVLRFAADFEQHCEGGAAALFGSVRFNSSVPISPRPPSAYASAPGRAPEGGSVPLSASRSVDPQDSPLSFQWTQTSGPQVAILNATSSQASFVAPGVPPGGSDLTFRLDVTNGPGLADSTTVTVHIVDAADPRSVIYFHSQPGDYIGGGATTSYYEWDGTFTAQPRYGSLSNGVEIRFTNAAHWWYLEFAGIAGTGPLAPGIYLLAERAPFASAGHPGLDVFGDGVGCNTLSGHFTVLEAVYGTNNDVLKFAADFEQHCEGGVSALFGSVRFNSSVPVSPRPPSVYATVSPRVLEGTTATLDASRSIDPQDSPLAFQWTQTAGPQLTILNASSAIASFVAPNVAPGGIDVALRIDVTNGLGLASSASFNVHVVDAGDPKTFIYLHSQAGDNIGRGATVSHYEWDGPFAVGPYNGTLSTGIHVQYNGSDSWGLSFAGAAGTGPLVPGNYLAAERIYMAQPGHPGLDVSSLNGGWCSLINGRFNVLEAVYGPNNDVLKFSADFEAHCDGAAAAMFGSVRVNTALPIGTRPPSAYASAPGLAPEGSTVTLSASRSVDPQESPLSFNWTQTSGPQVAIVNATSSQSSFVAPDVPPGGSDLAFRLEVTNGLGLSDSAAITVHVLDATDPRSVIYFQSEPGDPVGGGSTSSYNEWDGAFAAQPRYGNLSAGVQLSFTSPAHSWYLNFAGIAGTGPLAPGTYPLAERAPFASPGHPGLDVYGDGRGCNALGGRFTVLEAVYGTNNDVLKFAADFEQHCESRVSALFGSVRFNSSVPVSPRPPSTPIVTRVIAGYQRATVFFNAPVDNGTSRVTGYTVTCSAPGQTTRSSIGTGSPIAVLGLTVGVAYKCSVVATNHDGSSASSAAISVTPSARIDLSAILMLLLN